MSSFLETHEETTTEKVFENIYAILAITFQIYLSRWLTDLYLVCFRIKPDFGASGLRIVCGKVTIIEFFFSRPKMENTYMLRAIPVGCWRGAAAKVSYARLPTNSFRG